MHGLPLTHAHNPRRVALVVLALLLPLSGCGLADRLFDAQHGFLLQGFDVLALPSEPVQLSVRLQEGSFLWDKPGRTLAFDLDGREIGRAVTDRHGMAHLPCTAPDRPGDYRVTITPADPKLAQRTGSASLLLAVRDRDESFLVSDLDHTVVADGTKAVLVGRPAPMAESVRVLWRIHDEKGYSIIYLTHRPEFLGKKSQDWLAQRRFPPGPLLLSPRTGPLPDSGRDKAARLRELVTRFPNLRVGVGDRVSDAHAYREGGIPICVFIFQPASPGHVRREQVADLAELDPAVQVVTHWLQIELIVFDNARFPRDEALGKLR